MTNISNKTKYNQNLPTKKGHEKSIRKQSYLILRLKWEKTMSTKHNLK